MFVEDLRRELSRRSYATLICGSDSTLLAVSQARDALQPLTELGLPPQAVVARALSRESLAQTAEQAGLASTLSIRCVGLEQALGAAGELGFPVVLKSPEAASADGRAASGSPKSRIVTTDADLAKAAPAFRDGLLVQRWVPGNLISVGGVIADGRILAAAVARYERMWPPEGGSIAFGETITPPPGLEDSVQRLLAAIGWEGIFELELIQTRSGGFAPIDFNPRPYGSMTMATSAGAPLAAIWCDWLLGRDPQPAYARAGCRYRWEDGESAAYDLAAATGARRISAQAAATSSRRGPRALSKIRPDATAGPLALSGQKALGRGAHADAMTRRWQLSDWQLSSYAPGTAERACSRQPN